MEDPAVWHHDVVRMDVQIVLGNASAVHGRLVQHERIDPGRHSLAKPIGHRRLRRQVDDGGWQKHGDHGLYLVSSLRWQSIARRKSSWRRDAQATIINTQVEQVRMVFKWAKCLPTYCKQLGKRI